MRSVASALLLGFAATAMSAAPASASTPTARDVAPVAIDAHVKVAHKSTNYGSTKRLVVDGRAATRTVAMLRIRVPQEAASLQLVLSPSTSVREGVRVFRTGRNWTESTVTWKKRPQGGKTLLGVSDALRSGVSEVIDLDRAQVSPGAMLSLRITTRARAKVKFASTEAAASKRPHVQYATTPPTVVPPEPTRTMFGACPTVGTPTSSVISKYGNGASVRIFEPGGFKAVSRPAGASMTHVSWKPALGGTITDAQLVSAFANLEDGDLVEVWHESDVKYRQGADLAPLLALKNAFHDRVVALRDAERIPKVLTVNTWSGWSVDSRSNVDPSNLHARADILGLDMDGIPASDSFYPYAENQMGEKFISAYRAGGYSGWTVPEFSMPSVPSDPTRARRIAWFQSEVQKISQGLPSAGIPAPRMIAWFDTAGIIGETEKLTEANEIAAWSATVATNLAPRTAVDRPLIAYGSSSMAGLYDENAGLPARLATLFGVPAHQRAVSGSLSADALAAMRSSTAVEKSYYTLIWTGKNDVSKGLPVSTPVDNIASMVDLATGPYLVLGHFADIGASPAIRQRVFAQNATLEATYGPRYVDVARYLASSQVWADTGITPTDADLAAQRVPHLPPSLSHDNFHLNSAAQSAVAELVGDQMTALG